MRALHHGDVGGRLEGFGVGVARAEVVAAKADSVNDIDFGRRRVGGAGFFILDVTEAAFPHRV